MAQDSQDQKRSSGSKSSDSGRSGRVVRPTVVSTRTSYRRGRRYQSRRKVCLYCADKSKVINWKNTDDLRRFINSSGGIFPRRKTGLCAKHQRGVAVAVKRARHLALFPYTGEHVRIMGKGSR